MIASEVVDNLVISSFSAKLNLNFQEIHHLSYFEYKMMKSMFGIKKTKYYCEISISLISFLMRKISNQNKNQKEYKLCVDFCNFVFEFWPTLFSLFITMNHP